MEILPYFMLEISLFLILIIMLSFNTLVFIFACVKKDNSIVDIFYSTLFMLATLSAFCISVYTNIKINEPFNFYNLIITALILIWGIRLGVRIYKKNAGKPEDFRYNAWRNLWSEKGSLYFYLRSYMQIYLLQGVLAFLIISPALYFILSNQLNFNIPGSNLSHYSLYIFIFGFIIWVIGFLFEYFGDKQLDNFLKDKVKLSSEKIIVSGLWKYTRHPNYFGEATMWWGIYIMTISSLFSFLSYENGILAYSNTFNFVYLMITFVLSPIIITCLLRFVSGVPMLEKKWGEHPDTETKNKWLEYKKKTPAMIPKLF